MPSEVDISAEEDPIAALELELHYVNVSFALSFVVLAFCILGAITNFISTAVYCHPAMRSSINILLTGLSVIDMCLCICAIPTFVIPPMCVYVINTDGPDHFLCQATRFSTLYIYPLTTWVQSCSCWTYMVITFERWIAVCRPFQARWASTGRSLRALAAVCVLAAAYNFVRFFEHLPPTPKTSPARSLNGSQYTNETLPPEQETLVDELLRKDEYYMKVYYSGLYLVTHFLIPFTVLAGVNGKMIYSIHRARQQRRMLSHSEQKEHRTAVMMGAVVLMFVCSNSMTFVLNFIEQVDKQLFQYPSTKVLMFTLNDVSNLLVLINAATTFGFYYACSQKYRQLLHYYVVHYWCAPCVSVACPSNFEERRSRLRASKMAFSFQSAISLYAPPANENGGHAYSSSCPSRRSSSGRVERKHCGSGHHMHGFSCSMHSSDESKCLISNGQYLDPNRKRETDGRRWSATSEPPLNRDRLTVPSVRRHGHSQSDGARWCSRASLRSAQ